MKKAAVLCAAVIAASVQVADAATQGAYAGLGIGGSRLDTPTTNFYQPAFPGNALLPIADSTTVRKSHSIGGLGGRIFGGYNFNEYLGLEAGFSKFASSSYKYSQYNVTNATPDTAALTSSVSGNKEYSLYAFDLVGKGYLPIYDSGFNLYGLAGLARVNSKVEDKVTGKVTGAANTASRSSKTTTAIRPVFGVGVSYDIKNTGLSTAIEFRRIQGKGNVKTSNTAIPNADLLSLGLTYTFS